MKVNKLYLVVRIALPLYWLLITLFSCRCGLFWALTVLRLALTLSEGLPLASKEIWLGSVSAAEYLPRLESHCNSCRQRCCTQWNLSIDSAKRLNGADNAHTVFILHKIKVNVIYFSKSRNNRNELCGTKYLKDTFNSFCYRNTKHIFLVLYYHIVRKCHRQETEKYFF